MLIKNAKVFHSDGYFEERNLYVQEDKITETASEEIVIDAKGLYAIPGLTDIHFHGCVGHDFCEGTHEAIREMAMYQAKNGITTICPATMTLPKSKLKEICEAASSYKSEEGAILCGINMEGPFLSLAKKGAQNPAFLRKADVEEFRYLQKVSGNLIKLVAIAPETEGAMEFISELQDEVKPSIAHSTANYGTAKVAIAFGAKHVTHLFNAMEPFNNRAPGIVGAAFDSKDCEVEMICDGVHIHPSVVRAAFKMFGDDRIILISDSMEATGMPDGDYLLGGLAVTKKGNAAVLSDGTLAGSVSNLMNCVRAVILQMGIPFAQAIKCAAVNSAKSIGIYNQYGSLEVGKYANIVLLDEALELNKVFICGKEVMIQQ